MVISVAKLWPLPKKSSFLSSKLSTLLDPFCLNSFAQVTGGREWPEEVGGALESLR